MDSRFRKTQNGLAIEDYDSAIELAPSESVAYYDRGLAYRNHGEVAQAISDYNAAIRLNSNYADAYDDRALAFVRRRDYDLALADLDRAVALDPKNARHVSNRAEVYYRRGDIDKAIVGNAQAISIDPNYAGAYEFRGDMAFARGDYDSAIADYDRSLSLPRFFFGVYIKRGDAYLRLGNFTAAADDFRHAERYQGLAPGAAFSLGRLQTYTRDFSKADASFSYAIKHLPAAADRSYVVVWTFLAAIRSGVKPRAEPTPRATDTDIVARNKWPWPVIAMFLGRLDVDQVLGAARNVDPTLQRSQLCEAYYYSAEYVLALQQTERGIGLFDRARDTCPLNYVEYEAAHVRLAELDF